MNQDANKRIKFARITFALIAFLSIVFVVLFIIVNREKSFGYKILPLPQNNFRQVIDNNLYFYNGVAFYSQDLSSNTRKIINYSPSLPNIDRVYWSEGGAILQFSEMTPLDFTVINWGGQRQDAQSIANAQGFSRSDLGRVAWYLDFSTGDLYFVDVFQDTNWKTMESLPNPKTFLLYGRSSLTGSSPTSVAVNFTPGKRTELVLEVSNLSTTSLSKAFRCVDGRLICVVGQSRDGRIFIKSIADKKVDISLDPNSTVNSSNHANYVLVGQLTQEAGKNPDNEMDHSHGEEYAYRILDIKNGESSPISFDGEPGYVTASDISDTGIIVYTKDTEGNTVINYGPHNRKPKLTPAQLGVNLDIKNIMGNVDGVSILVQNSGSIALVGETDYINEVKALPSAGSRPTSLAGCLKESDAKSMSNNVITITIDESRINRMEEIRNCYEKLDTDPLLYFIKFEVVAFRTIN